MGSLVCQTHSGKDSGLMAMEVSQEVSSMVRGWLRASPSAGRCRLPTTCAIVTPRPERLGLGATPSSEDTLEASNKSTLASIIGKKLSKRRKRGRGDWEEQGEDCRTELSRAIKAESSSDEECSRSVAIGSAKRPAERQPGGIGSLGKKRRKRKKKKLQKGEELEESSNSAFPDAALDLNESKPSMEPLGIRVNAVNSQSSMKGVLEASIAVEDTSERGRGVETGGLPAQEKPSRTKHLLLGGSRKLKKRRLEQVKVLRIRKSAKGRRCHSKAELKRSHRTDAKARNTAAVAELTESVIPAVEFRAATKLSESERGGKTAGTTGVAHKRKKKQAKAERPQHGLLQHSLAVEESRNATDNADVCLHGVSPSTSGPQTTSTKSAVVSQPSATNRIRTVEHKMTPSKLLRSQRKLKLLRRGKHSL